jgi:hypothetical protein
MSQKIKILRRRASKQIATHKDDGWTVIDVTSKGEQPYIRFSPFYPHGNIPIPGFMNVKSASVEGVWQGLKVFEKTGIDENSFSNTTMQKLKRNVSAKNGKVIGHLLRNLDTTENIISYIDARKKIYIPTYMYALNNFLQDELKELSTIPKLVLLDYDVNEDIEDTCSPLSHASLIKKYLLSG